MSGQTILVVAAIIGALAVIVPVLWKVSRVVSELVELLATHRELVDQVRKITERLEAVERGGGGASRHRWG